MLAGGVAGIAPDHTGLEAAHPAPGVDLDSVHALGLDQDRPVEGAAARGAVAGALRGDSKAVRPREGDHRRHVIDRLDVRDRRRVLVGDQVPGRARVVPALLAGRDGGAAQIAVQLRHVNRPLFHGLHCLSLPRCPPGRHRLLTSFGART